MKKIKSALLCLVGIVVAGSGMAGTTFAPLFTNDITAAVNGTGFSRNGNFNFVNGDCTGIVSCGDFFDISLIAGDLFTVSFCDDIGADASAYDPSLAIYASTDLVNPVASNDDNCAGDFLSSRIDFIVPSNGTYRVALGTFSNSAGGPYTLGFAVQAPPTIPTLSEWGLIFMGLVLLAVGARSLRTRNQIAA